MRPTRRCLIRGFVAVAAPVVALTGALPAGAAPSTNCQSSRAATVCAQGGITGESGVTGSTGHQGIEAPYGGGCTSQYGTYQNCAIDDNFFGSRFAR